MHAFEKVEKLQLDKDCKRILNRLLLKDGFVPLIDSSDTNQTMEAVGLREKRFSQAFVKLRSEKYVEGKADGLHLRRRERKN